MVTAVSLTLLARIRIRVGLNLRLSAWIERVWTIKLILESGTASSTARYLLRSFPNNLVTRGENHGPWNSSLDAGRPHSRDTAVGHVLASLTYRATITPSSGH